MYSSKALLLIAALAGTSLAQKSDSEFCASYLSSFFTVLGAESPTTPADILSFIASNTDIPSVPSSQPPGAILNPAEHQSQLCSLATELPSSLLPEFQTLASGLLSFGKAHSSDFIAYVTDCYPEDEVASSTSYLNYIFTATGNICEETATATPTPGAASNGTYPTAVPTATSAVNGSTPLTTSLIPTAAAARPTGAILGAAAVGGILGAAAML
ncbi:hypothetical protein F5Y09DRAFT_134840 [Xylaria sp. FL1042]|nr:hypothetical protein F5Y09DRAFT_134840 [Xylaria sp. FL1042]